jgi:hypothetical protein
VLSAAARVKIRAAVVEFPGAVSSLALLDPEDRSVQRLRTTATFDALGEHPVRMYEEDSHSRRSRPARPATCGSPWAGSGRREYRTTMSIGR